MGEKNREWRAKFVKEVWCIENGPHWLRYGVWELGSQENGEWWEESG